MVFATEPARLASKGAAALIARVPCLWGEGWLNSLLSASPAEIQACQDLGGTESVLGGYLAFDGPASGVGGGPAYGHNDVEDPGAYL